MSSTFEPERWAGDMMRETYRATAREIAHRHLDAGDPLGWFEALYAQAGDDTSIIPWAELKPNPNLLDWLNQNGPGGSGLALKVGSGLGDDAEELARRGFETTAFDISESAIALSRSRFPDSVVSYVVADLFSAPDEWRSRFDLVLESYTLQVLPPALRADAIRYISSFVAPGGILLVIARGREPDDPEGKMPWPLTRNALALFRNHDLTEVSFEDYMDNEEPPVRRYRATYCRGQRRCPTNRMTATEDGPLEYLYIKDKTWTTVGLSVEEAVPDKATTLEEAHQEFKQSGWAPGQGEIRKDAKKSSAVVEGLKNCYYSIIETFDMPPASANRRYLFDGVRMRFEFNEAVQGFEQTQRQSPHELFWYLLCGELEARVGDENEQVGSGGVIHIPKGESYHILSEKNKCVRYLNVCSTPVLESVLEE